MYALLLVGLLLPSQSDEQKQINKQVSEFARKFYSACEAGQLDTLLGMVSTPWYHDGQTILKTADELRVELKKLIDQRDTSTKRTPEVKLVAAYVHMKERMSPKDRELLEQVARDDDYLALVMLKPADRAVKQSDNVVLLVRIKDAKAIAIGVKHTQ